MTHPRLPLTRDVRVVAAACAIVQAELLFQADRIEHSIPNTSNEADYLRRLIAEYRASARSLATLRRYQEGRLARKRADAEDVDVSDAILDVGRDIRPFVTDPERDRADV